MKKQKLIFLMFILSPLICISCFNCKTNSASTETTDLKNKNYSGNLILYAELDSQKNIRRGYIDEETGEIVIKAQYVDASPFVGNYAVVEYENNDYQSKKNYNKRIINKAGKIIKTGKFEEAYILTSESGKSTAAILENTREKREFAPFYMWGLLMKFDGKISQKEEYYIYNVINLETGKEILHEKKGVLIYNIENVGDYFVARRDLYQFIDNGDIQCVAKNNPELAVSILKDYFLKRGINAQVEEGITNIRINYSEYIEEKYANPDFSGAFNKLNKNFNVPFEKYKNFYRDPKIYLNTQLEITERKYLMYFKNEKTSEYAVGLYNETKEEWEIYPNFIIDFSDQKDKNISNKKIKFYVVDIDQTNNPNLYRLQFKNDEIGWDNTTTAFIGGSIYSTEKEDFVQGLYLHTDSIHRHFPGPFEKDNNINFPKSGMYYRDLSRIME
jgi:hypothetical protein